MHGEFDTIQHVLISINRKKGSDLNNWPSNPLIYEINTPVWLNELSQRQKRDVTLGTVPPEAWNELAGAGFDAVWFMGVWQRSPEGVRISNGHEGLRQEFFKALPDFSRVDNLGSAYSIRSYEVDERWGGRSGLAEARRQLASRGLRLLLDYVPNHVARDHDWVLDHPEYFISASRKELMNDPREYFESAGRVIACGKDPNFPAWEDVAQVNAFNPGFRMAARATVLDIAVQCDGVRCDMAMLLLDRIFSTTWGGKASQALPTPFWKEVTGAVKRRFPDFLFIAEAYWGTEPELVKEGFSYCYDKEFYDRLKQGDSRGVAESLIQAGPHPRTVRFIENHDEARAAVAFPQERAMAAAFILATIPGARLFHQGQLEGRTLRLPVFLHRWGVEMPDKKLLDFYRGLLRFIQTPSLKTGEWEFLGSTQEPCLAWTWKNKAEWIVAVVNYSASPAERVLDIPFECRLAADGFSSPGSTIEVHPDGKSALKVKMPGWGYTLARLHPV